MKFVIDCPPLTRAEKLLRGIPGALERVERRSFNDAAAAGKTEATRQIKQRYAIRYSKLQEKMKITHSPFVPGEGVRIDFTSPKYGLYRYTTKPTVRTNARERVPAPIPLKRAKNVTDRERQRAAKEDRSYVWRMVYKNRPVSAMDVREKGLTPRPHGFITTFDSGHIGLFHREANHLTETGLHRLDEYGGFSVEDMLSYGPAKEAVGTAMQKRMSSRAEHYIGLELEKATDGK